MSKIGKYFLRKKEQLNLICIYEDKISYCFQLELKQYLRGHSFTNYVNKILSDFEFWPQPSPGCSCLLLYVNIFLKFLIPTFPLDVHVVCECPPKYTDIACFLTIVTETDLYLWGQKISHLSLFFLYFCNIKANSAYLKKM